MGCVRGCVQQVDGLDKRCATPRVLWVLRPLTVMSMGMGLHVFCFGIMTAFLQAFRNPEGPPIFVWPPEEFAHGDQISWKLRRATYGLRDALKD